MIPKDIEDLLRSRDAKKVGEAHRALDNAILEAGKDPKLDSLIIRKAKRARLRLKEHLLTLSPVAKTG